jgi:hypothetical protein
LRRILVEHCGRLKKKPNYLFYFLFQLLYNHCTMIRIMC